MRSAAPIVFLFIAITLFTGLPQAVFGVSETTTGGSLAARLTPENPGPFTKTTVRLSSTDADLDDAVITWFLNQARALQGAGLREFEFRTGAAGEASVLDISLKTKDGVVISKTLTIVPQNLAVVWQADTYVPPLYRGKALASPESEVTLSAIADFRLRGGAPIDARTLIYRWFEGFRELSSGTTKNTLTVRAPIPPQKKEIRLLVTDTSGELVAEKKTTLSGRAPLILFYAEHPTRGTRYSSALNPSASLRATEAVVRAEPLFFSLGDDTDFSWRLNGTAAAADSDDLRLITVRSEGGTGTSLLLLSVENTKKLFQEARETLSIAFGSFVGGEE